MCQAAVNEKSFLILRLRRHGAYKKILINFK